MVLLGVGLWDALRPSMAEGPASSGREDLFHSFSPFLRREIACEGDPVICRFLELPRCLLFSAYCDEVANGSPARERKTVMELARWRELSKR